jgi:hypothetical protein
MSDPHYCPLDGNIRIRKSTTDAAWWHCGWCGQDEQIDDDPTRAALQREWE